MQEKKDSSTSKGKQRIPETQEAKLAVLGPESEGPQIKAESFAVSQSHPSYSLNEWSIEDEEDLERALWAGLAQAAASTPPATQAAAASSSSAYAAAQGLSELPDASIRFFSTKKTRLELEYDYLFKIALFGDSGVGRTALTERFCNNKFTNQHKPTMGQDFKINAASADYKVISIGNKVIELQILEPEADYPDQIFDVKSYCSEPHAVIIAFDVTNRCTFNNLSKWLEIIKNKFFKKPNIILAANKIDLPNRLVSPKEYFDFAAKNDLTLVETSAKTGENVESLFFQTALKIKERICNPIKMSEEPQQHSDPEDSGKSSNVM